MQTAIQQMIEKIINIKSDTLDKGNVLHFLQYQLEVEKKQIIDAYTESIDNERLSSSEIKQIGETYYNKTFNQ